MLDVCHIYRKTCVKSSNMTYIKRKPGVNRAFSFRLVLTGKRCLQVCDVKCGIEETSIFQQLLAVPSHNSLRRNEGVRIHDGRSRKKWYIWCVNVPRVESRWSLESHEDFAVGEQWVFVELHAALELADVEDSEVDAFGGECVACSEVVQLFEFAGEVS